MFSNYLRRLLTSVVLFSVWRPLQPCLRDWPLALCDARTVSPDDKVGADLVYPGFEGENTFLYFSPNLDFYFVDCQSQDEIWVFKQYDSKDGVANSEHSNISRNHIMT